MFFLRVPHISGELVVYSLWRPSAYSSAAERYHVLELKPGSYGLRDVHGW